MIYPRDRIYLLTCNCLIFTSEPRLASFICFLPTLEEQNLWGEVAQVYIGQMPFLLPNNNVKALKKTQNTDPNQ